MTYVVDTCKRCKATFFWHGQPSPDAKPICNTCENELAELGREIEATANALATHWDEP